MAGWIRTLTSVVALAVAASVVVVASPPRPALAEPETSVPVSTVDDLVIDPGTGRVFASGDDAVAVLAPDGTLVKLIGGIPAKINLIPFNPWPGTDYECSDWEQIEKFADFINANGYASPIRTPRGRDILAACGQLKSESERLKKTERLALEAMMIAGHGEA